MAWRGACCVHSVGFPITKMKSSYKPRYDRPLSAFLLGLQCLLAGGQYKEDSDLQTFHHWVTIQSLPGGIKTTCFHHLL